jgi:hypothetical protein
MTTEYKTAGTTSLPRHFEKSFFVVAAYEECDALMRRWETDGLLSGILGIAIFSCEIDPRLSLLRTQI